MRAESWDLTHSSGCRPMGLNRFGKAARLKPDYIGFGPIFSTTTKADHDPVVGLDGLRAARALTTMPIFCNRWHHGGQRGGHRRGGSEWRGGDLGDSEGPGPRAGDQDLPATLGKTSSANSPIGRLSAAASTASGHAQSAQDDRAGDRATARRLARATTPPWISAVLPNRIGKYRCFIQHERRLESCDARARPASAVRG